MAAMKWWSCRLCARPARKADEVEELDAGEHREGTFAEWISVPVRNVFAMPGQLDFVQAGALDVNFLTTCWPLSGTTPSCPLWTAISPLPSIHAALSRLESG
jgi:D-arabinose 1-dehydrogenase-like Zn-dependent alcohol dehydrogenase